MRLPSPFRLPRSRPARVVAVGAALGGLALLGTLPGCAYIAQAAKGHLELMAGAEPLDEALARDDLTERERDRLELTRRIKAFGEEQLGMLPTKNYETVNLDFDQVVWNVSGAAPDRFESHVYRYPVVGALPYIGFFDRAEGDAEAARLESLGWETWVRPAGAYSTLGWFKDPLWRSMLQWGTAGFANTVLHELAHATVWIPGEGRFNESFATFLGDEASARFMESIREERPDDYHQWQDGLVDSAQYRAFMHDLYKRLGGLYAMGLPRDEVLRRKEETVAAARERYAELIWRNPAYADRMGPDMVVNNARMLQFRVYNTGLNDFDEALARFDGDLVAFLAAARELPARKKRSKGPWNPYEAVRTLTPNP